MLDVRSSADFAHSHIVSALSVPAEDGLDAPRLFQRILDHDEEWGWQMQFPFVVVFDEATCERANWLVSELRAAISDRADAKDFEGADRPERLLRRLAFQCQQILLLRHSNFVSAFGSCCTDGNEWKAAAFFDKLGPLPRCGLLHPRIYVAGRQVMLSADLIATLGVTHAVVNADALDAMDGTSGGGSQRPFTERAADVHGVRYLKCAISENQQDADEVDMPRVFEGAAQFLAACSAEGGVGLVRMHGQSCSAGVVCAFLVSTWGLTVESAWRKVQEACIKVDERFVWWDALRRLPPGKQPLEDAPASPS
jgi:hypothetical protein